MKNAGLAGLDKLILKWTLRQEALLDIKIKGYFKCLKVSLTRILNLHFHNDIASKYAKQTSVELKGKMDKYINQLDMSILSALTPT